MKALVASVALALAVSAPAEPKAPCPFHETGTGRPWAMSQVMDGDLWAHVKSLPQSPEAKDIPLLMRIISAR